MELVEKFSLVLATLGLAVATLAGCAHQIERPVQEPEIALHRRPHLAFELSPPPGRIFMRESGERRAESGELYVRVLNVTIYVYVYVYIYTCNWSWLVWGGFSTLAIQ
jgi:hypothetical protein